MARFIICLFILLGPALLGGLLSCETCNPAPYHYGVEDYKIYPRRISKLMTQSYPADTLAVSDTVNYQDLELILMGKEVLVATHNQSVVGSAVWACDPAYIPVDSVKHLTIISTQAYSPSFGIDQDLAAMMTIEQDSYDRKRIREFLAMPFPPAQPYFSLRFTQAPNRLGAYQFKIIIDLGNGKISSFLTRPILIKP